MLQFMGLQSQTWLSDWTELNWNWINNDSFYLNLMKVRQKNFFIIQKKSLNSFTWKKKLCSNLNFYTIKLMFIRLKKVTVTFVFHCLVYIKFNSWSWIYKLRVNKAIRLISSSIKHANLQYMISKVPLSFKIRFNLVLKALIPKAA